jgi:spore maturation protein CgeB
MKIFVAGPDHHDTFSHNVAHTFREMGHEVYTDPAERTTMRHSFLRRGVEEILTKASSRWRLRGDERAIRAARAFRPALTVICTGTLEPESIRAIREASGGLVVCWYGDAPANLKRGHVVSGEYDAVFAKDPDFVHRMRHMLGLEAHVLLEACNPSWHRPVVGRKGDDVVVAGSSYGYRNTMVARLLDAGRAVKVYGSEPSAWVEPRVRAAHAGRYLDERDKARVFGEALACLCTFHPAESPNSVNCRVFETCGCGGLMAAERRQALSEVFEPGVEFFAYDSFEELVAGLDRYGRDEAAAREMRERAVRRAHGEHTYRQRLTSMLETLGLAA